MSFLRDRTVGHSACLEALADTLNGLYLVNGDTAVLGIVEVKETSEGEFVVLTGNSCGVCLECIVISRPCCLLEQMYCLGSIEVVGLAAAELVAACAADICIHSKSEWIECCCVELLCALAYIAEANTADSADCSCKIAVDKLL